MDAVLGPCFWTLVSLCCFSKMAENYKLKTAPHTDIVIGKPPQGGQQLGMGLRT